MPLRRSKDKAVRRWKPEQLPPNFAILLCSARRSGKSTLLKSLCLQEPGSWLSRFDEGYIIAFCGNEHCAREYTPFIPGKYVHSSLRLDIIENYWAWCDKRREQGKNVPKSLFIFDDVLVTQSSKKHGVTRTSHEYWLNRLWAEGRHQNISCVLSVQSLSVGLPFLRCSDAFICFPSSLYCGQDQEMLTKNYMPCGSRKTAEAIADTFCQHEALICSYWRQESRRWQTRIFWYKVSKEIASFNGLETNSSSDGPPQEGIRPTGQDATGAAGHSETKNDRGKVAGAAARNPTRDERSGNPLETRSDVPETLHQS